MVSFDRVLCWLFCFFDVILNNFECFTLKKNNKKKYCTKLSLNWKNLIIILVSVIFNYSNKRMIDVMKNECKKIIGVRACDKLLCSQYSFSSKCVLIVYLQFACVVPCTIYIEVAESMWLQQQEGNFSEAA